MQVQLIMFRSDGQRREFDLRKSATVIGRATESDFQIPLPQVSRAHCQISIREDHVSVRDMGSSNGTFVNGQRVQESDLEAGDKLVIGPITFTIVIDGQPATIDVVPSSGNARSPQELDSGTVDVEAAMEQQTAPAVKRPAPAPASKPAARAPSTPPRLDPDPVDALDQIEEVEVLEEVVESDSAPAEPADNPLAALQALTRPKETPS